MVLYRWDHLPLEGLVDTAGYLREGRLEWMSAEGKLVSLPFTDCKALCFVTEAGGADLFSDNNLFERRPKSPGLWTRFTFRDGALLDGILSHNLLEWPEAGYMIVPPKARGSRQRVFIPRAALIGTELRGVVGVSLAAAGRLSGREKAEDQISLFEP